MALFPDIDPNALFFSRKDNDELLGAFIDLGFELDGASWPTVEHYYQAMKFDSDELKAKVRSAKTARKAQKIGKNFLNRLKVRKDWAEIKATVMTRAIYIRAKTHDKAARALLDTDGRQLMENDNYDYYWGCGRDRRGENRYGKVLMNVRGKLKQELEEKA